MFFMWVLTVLTDTNISAAISAFDSAVGRIAQDGCLAV